MSTAKARVKECSWESSECGAAPANKQRSPWPSSHVWMWELDYKESWAWKNWCFWTVVLDKTLESPLDCKEIHPVHPKGDRSWVFIGRTDVKAKTPIFWPPDLKSLLIWKAPDVGKDWRQEEKGTTEGEMVGWHHWLNGHGFGWTLGVGDGREAWCALVHGVIKSWTQLSDWTELTDSRALLCFPPIVYYNLRNSIWRDLVLIWYV